MSWSKRAQALHRQHEYISKDLSRFFTCTYDWYRLVLKARRYGFRWECPRCDAYVWCHKGTTQPLGTVARESLRMARIEAHEAFDKVWSGRSSGTMSARQRIRAYQWLGAKMELSHDECHIGMFDMAQCRKAIALCEYEYRTKYCPLKDLL